MSTWASANDEEIRLVLYKAQSSEKKKQTNEAKFKNHIQYRNAKPIKWSYAHAICKHIAYTFVSTMSEFEQSLLNSTGDVKPIFNLETHLNSWLIPGELKWKSYICIIQSGE